MDQQSISKMKLFRTLKVVYYCLGMPLFILACMTLASQMYGHWPFAGDPGTGSIGFEAFKVFFGSPAMYGVWIAFGIWLVIGIVQIICHKTVKNRRARTMIVVAVMLVVLIVPVFVIDAIFGAKVEQISADAAKGVVVEDYSYQLSYFHTKSGASGSTSGSNGKRLSLTDKLINSVEDFCSVYNIDYYGGAKISKANNFTNDGLYYDELGFDYNESGTIDVGDHILVTNTFDTKSAKAVDGRYWFDSIELTSKNGANTLEVEGNFYCIVFGQAIPSSYGSSETENVTCFIWYNGDKGSFAKTDGVYGNAFYNKNGLLSDGYIYDINVALNILESYYASQEEMAAAYKAYAAANSSAASEEELQALITEDAATRLYNRYNGADATDEDKTLWARENAMAAQYSLTAGELDIVLMELGEKVGTTSLIAELVPLVDTLGLIGSLLNIETILTDLLGDALGGFLYEKLNLTGVTIGIAYEGNLKLSLTGGAFSGANEVVIDFNDTLTAASLEADLIQVFKNVGIISSTAGDAEAKEALVGVLAKVIGLLGLSVSDDAADLSELLAGVLESLYWYQSPILDSVFDYFVDDTLDADNKADAALAQYQAAYSKFLRAQFEGGAHGYMIGSRLVGESIGDGAYSAAQGLATLAEVKQLQTDLSYQPTMYSIFVVRDMLMTFAAIIIFFTLLSYVAADREILYATGQIVPKAKKEKKSKKGEDTPEENAEPLLEENSIKEVE